MKKKLFFSLLVLIGFTNTKGQCPNNSTLISKEAVITNESYTVSISGSLSYSATWKLFENDYTQVASGNSDNTSVTLSRATPGYYHYAFEISSPGRCYTDYKYISINQSMSPNQYNSVITNSMLAFNGYKNNLYYINSNRYICALWNSGSAWEDAVLSQSKKAINQNSGLVVNTNTQDIYYIGESDRKIYKQYYSNGVWYASILASGQYNNARADSKLVIDQYFNHVFYVNTNNQICALWFDGSTWYDAIISATNFKSAYSGYGLYVSIDNQGTDVIYYIASSDRKMYKLAYDYSLGNYVCSQVCPGQYNLSNVYSDIIRNPGYNLYYVNSNRQLCCLWSYDGITYGDAVLSGSTLVKNNTRLGYDKVNDIVYFISDDNKIYRYTSGVGLAYNRQIAADASLLFDGNNIYFSHTANKHIYTFPVSSLKSAEFELVNNENENVIQSDFASIKDAEVFPNPTTGIIYLKNLDNKSSVEVYDNLGKLVYKNAAFTDGEIDLTGKQKGFYYLKIINNSKTVSKKILLQ